MTKDITFVHIPLLGYAMLQSPWTFGFNWRRAKNSRIVVIKEAGAPDLENILARESQRSVAKSLLLGAGGVGGAVGAGTTYAGATAAAACAGGVCQIPAITAGGAVASSGAIGLGAGAILSVLGWTVPATYFLGLAYKRLGARHVIRDLNEAISEATTQVYSAEHLEEVIHERHIELNLSAYQNLQGRMNLLQRGVERIIPKEELALQRVKLAKDFCILWRAASLYPHPHAVVMQRSYDYARMHFERRWVKKRPYIFFS